MIHRRRRSSKGAPCTRAEDAAIGRAALPVSFVMAVIAAKTPGGSAATFSPAGARAGAGAALPHHGAGRGLPVRDEPGLARCLTTGNGVACCASLDLGYPTGLISSWLGFYSLSLACFLFAQHPLHERLALGSAWRTN